MEVVPLAFDLAGGLVPTPDDSYRSLADLECLLQLRAIRGAPPVKGGVLHLHPMFLHEYFYMDVINDLW